MDRVLYYGCNYILCYSVLGWGKVVTKYFITEEEVREYIRTHDEVEDYKVFALRGGFCNV